MDIRLERGFTLEEAIQMAYDDDIDVHEIYIEPPEANILTDKDSGEEDGGGLLDNLSGRQLLPKAELVLRSAVTVDEAEPEEILVRPANGSDPNDVYLDIFEEFLGDDVIGLLVEQSNKYALFCNQPHPNISKEEMKCAIGILIVTGYNELPGRDFYWDSKMDMKNSMVSDSMRRDRFRQIIKYLHCADNLQPHLQDKMWKLRPLMDLLKSKFIKNWIPEQDLDYDESMIKYFGKHSCKQFIRGKPIRFGYKMWCLNSATDYLVNFDMYQGKNPRANTVYETHFENVLLH
ncbi:hypothetical protein NQ318_011735 [Aromia moschata]|uniref:PiggyBac transposable element-derived protein domain-containing protein n=1 Tax=Aromia moschata TaxID=1265417 RepID=A0AAV8XMW9_9CUCU|nr:hypothetical protein NQ318_011735 [Aromia moschata]